MKTAPARRPPGRNVILSAWFLGCATLWGATPTATSHLHVKFSPHPFATDLRPHSPFGIHTAFQPAAADLQARLQAMQAAGIKWGRQDFMWRRIEREPGNYDWAPYDQLADQCRQREPLLFGKTAPC